MVDKRKARRNCMSINIEKIIRLNELVNMFFRSKHTIVLEPKIREKIRKVFRGRYGI